MSKLSFLLDGMTLENRMELAVHPGRALDRATGLVPENNHINMDDAIANELVIPEFMHLTTPGV
jgi:hypothetical protein